MDENIQINSLQDAKSYIDELTSNFSVPTDFSNFVKKLMTFRSAYHKEVAEGTIVEKEGGRKAVWNIEEGDILKYQRSISHLVAKTRLYDGELNLKHLLSYLTPANTLSIIKVKRVTDNYIAGYIISNSEEGDGEFVLILKGEHFDMYDEVFVNLGIESPYIKHMRAIFKASLHIDQIIPAIRERAEQIQEIAEHYYPGRTDLRSCKDIPEESNLSTIAEDEIGNILIIHFPEIEIRNRNDKRHKIHDLYVAFHIFPDGTSSSLWGLRASMEAKEIKARYTHSHLGGDIFGWGTFCLGNGAFSDNFIVAKSEFDREAWEVALVHLKVYLEWESISGGPYKKIQWAITGGRGNSREMSTHIAKDVIRDMGNVLNGIYLSCLQIEVQDYGSGNTDLKIRGFEQVARAIKEGNYDQTGVEYTPPEEFADSFIHVTSDGREMSELSISSARQVAKNVGSTPEYRRAWNYGFNFQGERIEFSSFVEEDLYSDDFGSEHVDLPPAVKKILKSITTINFINQQLENIHVNEENQEEFEKIQEQEKEAEQAILESTPVF